VEALQRVISTFIFLFEEDHFLNEATIHSPEEVCKKQLASNSPQWNAEHKDDCPLWIVMRPRVWLPCIGDMSWWNWASLWTKCNSCAIVVLPNIYKFLHGWHDILVFLVKVIALLGYVRTNIIINFCVILKVESSFVLTLYNMHTGIFLTCECERYLTFAQGKTTASLAYNKHGTGALASYATLTFNSIMVMRQTIIYRAFFASNDQQNTFRTSDHGWTTCIHHTERKYVNNGFLHKWQYHKILCKTLLNVFLHTNIKNYTDP
jgi:hypothetical protein